MLAYCAASCVRILSELGDRLICLRPFEAHDEALDALLGAAEATRPAPFAARLPRFTPAAKCRRRKYDRSPPPTRHAATYDITFQARWPAARECSRPFYNAADAFITAECGLMIIFDYLFSRALLRRFDAITATSCLQLLNITRISHTHGLPMP